MKKILGVLAAALFAFAIAMPAHAQTTAPTPAPTTCTVHPCALVTGTETSAATATPVIVTVAACNGSASGCGTPATPGPNGWLLYTCAAQTTQSISCIVPGLQYGQLVQLAAQATFASGGAASAWSAPFQLQVGQAPAPVVPSGLGATQQ